MVLKWVLLHMKTKKSYKDIFRDICRLIDKKNIEGVKTYLKELGSTNEQINDFIDFLECKSIECIKKHFYTLRCYKCRKRIDKLFYNQHRTLCKDCFDKFVPKLKRDSQEYKDKYLYLIMLMNEDILKECGVID